MPENENYGASPSVPVKVRGALPKKRRVNLAEVTKKRVKWEVILPSIICFFAACFLFAKYAVVERPRALDDARARLEETRARFDASMATLDEYFADRDVYVHITWSDMTDEENALVDPLDVIDFLERVVFPVSPMSSISLSGNSVSFGVECDTLQDVLDFTRRVRENPMVASCTASSGNQSMVNTPEEGVTTKSTAQLTVHFVSGNNSERVARERSAAPAQPEETAEDILYGTGGGANAD